MQSLCKCNALVMQMQCLCILVAMQMQCKIMQIKSNQIKDKLNRNDIFIPVKKKIKNLIYKNIRIDRLIEI